MLMFGTRGCLRNAIMVKNQKQFSHMFHLIDKDESLLSVASDIEVLIAQFDKDCLGKIRQFPTL